MKIIVTKTNSNQKIKIKANTLYEENKLRVLKTAFDNYTLEELQEKLNIKNNEY